MIKCILSVAHSLITGNMRKGHAGEIIRFIIIIRFITSSFIRLGPRSLNERLLINPE